MRKLAFVFSLIISTTTIAQSAFHPDTVLGEINSEIIVLESFDYESDPHTNENTTYSYFVITYKNEHMARELPGGFVYLTTKGQLDEFVEILTDAVNNNSETENFWPIEHIKDYSCEVEESANGILIKRFDTDGSDSIESKIRLSQKEIQKLIDLLNKNVNHLN